MNDDLGVFSICSVNYLHKALALAESVFNIDRIKINIYIADKKIDIKINYDFVNVSWVEDLNIPDLTQLAFIYDVTEFNTCIKPYIALQLLKTKKKVIFLDPDIYVYSSLKCIHDYLNKYPILLTPHYTTPINEIEENYDLNMMRFGSFNLGFFAVSNEDEALKFLDWWSVRCFDLCFFETQFGLSTDQKWVSIAPCFFPNLHVLFELGFNMAFWNMHERILVKTNESYLVNNKWPLVFFHFSSFDVSNPTYVSKRLSTKVRQNRDDLNEICTDYAARILYYDDNYSKTAYGFDFLDDGTYISPTLRRAYACVRNKLNISNPFNNSKKMSIFIKQNYLLEKKGNIYKAKGHSDKNCNSKKFKIIYFILRRLLKYIGPNNFMNLSRLMVYLSSYRQNIDLWKTDKRR